MHVATQLESGLTIHGYIDRVDVAPTGEVRIVDYKTGRSPGEHFEAKALFQMKFYALVVWRTRGVIPRMLQLVYLGNAEMLRYEPDERDLLATERKVQALWDAIQRANESRRLPAQQVGPVRLVRPPGDLPGLGWHAAAAASARRPGAAQSPLVELVETRSPSSTDARWRSMLNHGWPSVQVAGDFDVVGAPELRVLALVEPHLTPQLFAGRRPTPVQNLASGVLRAHLVQHRLRATPASRHPTA